MLIIKSVQFHLRLMGDKFKPIKLSLALLKLCLLTLSMQYSYRSDADPIPLGCILVVLESLRRYPYLFFRKVSLNSIRVTLIKCRLFLIRVCLLLSSFTIAVLASVRIVFEIVKMRRVLSYLFICLSTTTVMPFAESMNVPH